MARKITPEQLRKKWTEFQKKLKADPKMPFTILTFCVFAGMAKRTFEYYAKEEAYSDIIEEIKTASENNLVNGMLTNRYNATAAIFLLKNHFGYKDSQIGSEDSPLLVKVIRETPPEPTEPKGG